MDELVRSISWPARREKGENFDPTREWLVTNGLGAYASGTISGVLTRRFHGILIAALPAPFGRMMMLNDLMEIVQLPDGSSVLLANQKRARRTPPPQNKAQKRRA